MDGMIVKLKNNKEENYLLPVTSSKAVFMENNDSVEKEFEKYIKKRSRSLRLLNLCGREDSNFHDLKRSQDP